MPSYKLQWQEIVDACSARKAIAIHPGWPLVLICQGTVRKSILFEGRPSHFPSIPGLNYHASPISIPLELTLQIHLAGMQSILAAGIDRCSYLLHITYFRYMWYKNNPWLCDKTIIYHEVLVEGCPEASSLKTSEFHIAVLSVKAI